MKKCLLLVLTLLLSLSLTACYFGDKHTTDPNQYQRNDGERNITYLPESIDNYTVNNYSYTTYRFFDTCTEIFLDITVSEEQYRQLMENAKKYSKDFTEQTAYYDKNYIEIVFSDDYALDDDTTADERNVGNADIEKVIFDKNKHNIIYEYFYAFDTGVYPLKNVAYFNRFNIDENEYMQYAENY